MNYYDYDRALVLLKITEHTRDLPKLKPMHDTAMAELEAMEPLTEEVADE